MAERRVFQVLVLSTAGSILFVVFFSQYYNSQPLEQQLPKPIRRDIHTQGE